MKRAPFSDAQIELRQIQEGQGFGANLPTEVRQQEQRLRAEIEKQKASSRNPNRDTAQSLFA
jgi:hypothetical protein